MVTAGESARVIPFHQVPSAQVPEEWLRFHWACGAEGGRHRKSAGTYYASTARLFLGRCCFTLP